MLTMDINTYEVKPLEISDRTLDLTGSMIASENYIFCVDHATGSVMAYDHNYENGKVLLEYDTSASFVWDYCYDSLTDEFYFNLLSNVCLGHKFEGAEIGDLYRVDSNLNCEKLDIADKVVNFAVTRNYIYFTQYDPIEYGETKFGLRIANVNGGNFYRVKRNGTGDVELVFDGGIDIYQIPYFPFFVFGDYMYYNWAYVGDWYGEQYGPIVARDDVRIGLTDKTVRSMSHD